MSEKQEPKGRFQRWLERRKEKAREGAAIQARMKAQRAENARHAKKDAGSHGGFGSI